MYDWTSSILPHRCKNCGRWIKPRTNHIVKYSYDMVERYCDPICAREQREREEQRRERRDKLSRMIYGGEEDNLDT